MGSLELPLRCNLTIAQAFRLYKITQCDHLFQLVFTHDSHVGTIANWSGKPPNPYVSLPTVPTNDTPGSVSHSPIYPNLPNSIVATENESHTVSHSLPSPPSLPHITFSFQ